MPSCSTPSRADMAHCVEPQPVTVEQVLIVLVVFAAIGAATWFLADFTTRHDNKTERE